MYHSVFEVFIEKVYTSSSSYRSLVRVSWLTRFVCNFAVVSRIATVPTAWCRTPLATEVEVGAITAEVEVGAIGAEVAIGAGIGVEVAIGAGTTTATTTITGE